jgi:multiple sugar transport system permease protein
MALGRAPRSARAHLPGLAFLLPAALGLGLFRFWPVVSAVEASFHQQSLINARRTFVGLANYARAFGDEAVLQSVGNTLTYAVAKVPIQVVLGLALALLVNRTGRAIWLVRSAIFLPVVTTLVVAATLWLLILQPDQGLMNGLLSTLRLPRQPFLRDVGQALPSLVAMMVWKDVGLAMLFFLAGLQGIPEVYYEAARTDGAGAWARFRYLTLPLLRGTLLFVVVMEVVFALRVFSPVYVMTQGGPRDATSVIVFQIYQQAFPLDSVGYASALSVLLLVFIALVTALLRRLAGGAVGY